MRFGYFRAALCGAAAAVVTAACDNLTSGPGGGREDSLLAPASMDRFGVEVRAAGAFRPGEPVQITVVSRANLRTSDAEIRLVLPEVAAARESSWERPRLPVDRPATPELSERAAMARGQTITRTVSVTVPRPGYYQVVATTAQRSEREDDEPPASGNDQNVAHDEIWLWIAESGGRATDRFDPSLFPAGTWQVPGPLSPTSGPRPGAGAETSAGPRPARSATGPSPSHSGYAGYVDSHAMYHNNDTGGLAPIRNARAEYTIMDRLGRFIRTEVKTTDAGGLSWVACYSDANGHGRYRYRVLLDNERVGMELPEVINLEGDFATDCGVAFTDQVPSTQSLGKERAHVYSNLDKGIRNGDAFFGIQRAKILVRLDPNASYSTYDWNGSDRLIIDTQPNTGYGDQVWGPYGAFVQAHEYGHAYHETALGGVKRYYTGACPSPHDMWRQTTHACAIAEGFPDYYSVVVLGSATGYMLTDIENGRYSPSSTNEWGFRPGDNGSIIEGAFASFLYDITDPANETHDQTAYPGRYVADIIRTCEVYSGAWRLNTGSDHVTYCFLGTITDTTAFGRSPAPTSLRHGAAEPEAYSTRYFKIRKNYQKNLFGNDV
jgi:hypothetical protein